VDLPDPEGLAELAPSAGAQQLHEVRKLHIAQVVERLAPVGVVPLGELRHRKGVAWQNRNRRMVRETLNLSKTFELN
jgi:hypothetical protein